MIPRILATLALLAASATLYAQPAQCYFCSTVPCITSGVCGGGCVCIRSGNQPTGYCASIQVQP